MVSPNAGTGSADNQTDHNAIADGLRVVSNIITVGDSEPIGENAYGLSDVEGDENSDWTVDLAFYLPDPTSVGLTGINTVVPSNTTAAVAALSTMWLTLNIMLRRKRCN